MKNSKFKSKPDQEKNALNRNIKNVLNDLTKPFILPSLFESKCDHAKNSIRYRKQMPEEAFNELEDGAFGVARDIMAAYVKTCGVAELRNLIKITKAPAKAQ